MTPNTEEYLRGFLPLCFLHSMDEASEDALADVLADYILNTASKVCDVERCAAPDENLVMGYAADLAGGICRKEYRRWDNVEEEILDRIAAYIEECQKADFPDAPQGSEEDRSL